MIGVRMGEDSGVWAIDPDASDAPHKPDGKANWANLCAKNGKCPPTHTHLTPGGGKHILFKYRADRPVTNSEGQLKGLGINVRGNGGYVIFPPSQRHDGKAYEVEEPIDYFSFADAPEWLYDLISSSKPTPEPQRSISERAVASIARRDTRSYAEAALTGEIGNVALAPPGSRNNQLNTSSMKLGQLVAGGHLSENVALGGLYDAAVASGLVAEDGQRSALNTINSGFRKGLQEPRSIPERRSGPALVPKQDPAPVTTSLRTITPSSWKGKEPEQQRWLAHARVPAGDLTLYAGNGGAGKTETAVQLLVSVAGGLSDWLGCVVENGIALFISCEEDETNIRGRMERCIFQVWEVDVQPLQHRVHIDLTMLADAAFARRLVGLCATAKSQWPAIKRFAFRRVTCHTSATRGALHRAGRPFRHRLRSSIWLKRNISIRSMRLGTIIRSGRGVAIPTGIWAATGGGLLHASPLNSQQGSI